MNALAARRRHPAAIAVLLLFALILVGAAYALVAPRQASAAAVGADQIAEGHQLFKANCATCHGMNGEGITTTEADGTERVYGPSLAGVGAASVDFQLGTGRMPLAAPGQQAVRNNAMIKFSQEEIDQMAAYVASLAPGPAVPEAQWLDASKGDPGLGGQIYRVNCAMCHSSAAAGGALTRGKSAPTLEGVEPKHIYEALVTGPQSMPVFSDANLSPKDKRDVIAYLETMQATGNPGGMSLGNFGPVPEGLFAWVFGLGLMVAGAVWLGQKGA